MTVASKPARTGAAQQELRGAALGDSVLAESSWGSQSVQLSDTDGTYVPSMEQAKVQMTGLDEVHWDLAYDRASIDRFTVEVEAERARLLAAIEEAQARAEAAKSGAATRHHSAQAQLGALVLAAQAELAQIEREHHEIVSAIRTNAEAEAARVLAAARAEAAAVRDAASSMGVLVNGVGPTLDPLLVELDELGADHSSGPTSDRSIVDLNALGTDHSGVRARFDAG